MTPTFATKYIYTTRWGGPSHHWEVLGGRGAVHLHIRGYSAGTDKPMDYSSGLEFHSPVPPDGHEHDAPHHKECKILGRPCWHDGTSLYAEEYFFPMWKDDPHNHDAMFRRLEAEYMKHFAREDDQ